MLGYKCTFDNSKLAMCFYRCNIQWLKHLQGDALEAKLLEPDVSYTMHGTQHALLPKAGSQ